MNKFLRNALALLALMVSVVSFGQTTVTFTAGTDKGAYTNANTGGDEVSKDGITMKTITGNSGFATAQYRLAKGSVTEISSTVGNITKIVFTTTNQAGYNATGFADTEGLTKETTTATWEGNATSVQVTAENHQVRLTTVEVTYTAGGTPTPTVEAPTISGTTPFTDKTTVTITVPTGTTVYYTTDGSTPSDQGDDYTEPFELTATTTVKAVAYKGDDKSQVVTKEFVKQASVTGEGTIANPYTVADAIALTNALPADTAYYKGTIKYIKEVDTGSYGNATYSITSAGSTDTLLVYRGYYLQNKKFTAKDQIKVGDEVIVNGKLINYNNNTLELAQRNYIYSLNGKTTGEDTPVTPKDTANYTVAQATAVLTAGTETTDIVYVNGTVSKIDEVSAQYGNATYYISDDGTENGQLQVFRGKYLNNEKFTSEDQLKVGDKVKIAGVLKNYTNGETTTQEVTNSWIVSISSSTTPDEPTTETVSLPYEDLTTGQGKFTINNVTVPDGTTYVWKWDDSQKYMKASGYVRRKNSDAESWLVSPLINLTKATSPSLSFDQTGKFFGTMADEATVWAKAEGDADWTQLTVPTYMTGSDWNFVTATISLKDFVGKNVQIAFKYVSSTSAAGTWEIKNISVKDEGGETPSEEKGTEANPYTPAEANEAGKALSSGAKSEKAVYVKGIVSSIRSVDTSRYGNARFYISADGSETDQFYCFDCFNLNGAKFTDASEISVGDEVVVTGQLQNYNGTIELARGGKIAQTNHSDKPKADENAASIAEFNGKDNNTDVITTLKDAQVVYKWTSNNDNTSIYVRDNSGALLIYNKKSDAVKLNLETGDRLNGTINLTRTEYNNSVQAAVNSKTNTDNINKTTGWDVIPKTIAYTDAKNHVSDLVLVENVNIVADGQDSKGNTLYYIGTGDDRLQVYNGFHIDNYELAEAQNVSVRGIVVRYKDTYEIYPTEAPVATGINSIKNNAEAIDTNAPIYNLAGQRVSKDYKGVVIQNGKKRINR